jgi:hypothetical protein
MQQHVEEAGVYAGMKDDALQWRNESKRTSTEQSPAHHCP